MATRRACKTHRCGKWVRKRYAGILSRRRNLYVPSVLQAASLQVCGLCMLREVRGTMLSQCRLISWWTPHTPMVKRLSCLPSKQAAGVRLPFGVHNPLIHMCPFLTSSRRLSKIVACLEQELESLCYLRTVIATPNEMASMTAICIPSCECCSCI